MHALAISALFAAALAAPQPFSRRGGAYVSYNGDGSSGQGWPAESSWASFDSMWSGNLNMMTNSCSYFGVPNTSQAEASDMKNAIQTVSKSTGVDPRVILAIVIQESKGCVRVWQTGNGVTNPGLMQDHAGTHMCNTAMASPTGGKVQNPCPQAEILGMIQDGTAGTASGDGLKQLGGTSKNAQDVYKMARKYNSGSNVATADLGLAAGATASYSSDIANRLMGVVFDGTSFKYGAPGKGPASSGPSKVGDGGSSAPPPPPASGSGDCKTKYTVASGDSCWKIANDHGISVSTLQSLSPSANCNNLQIGTVMCVAK